MSLNESVVELISLLDSNVKDDAQSYLTALPFSDIDNHIKELLFEELLKRNCFPPLFNLSLIYELQSIDTLMAKCLESDEACKVLMNLTRTFDSISFKVISHKLYSEFIKIDYSSKYGCIVNISRLKESHLVLLHHLTAWLSKPFFITIFKNISMNIQTHNELLKHLPSILLRLVATGFHDSIIEDERALEEFDKNEINDFVFTTTESDLDNPDDLIVLLDTMMILLNGHSSSRNTVQSFGLYYILRHLDRYCDSKKWETVNLAIHNCVELLLAKEE